MHKNILGLSFGYHDASVSLVSPDGDILFASHVERYSKTKNDHNLCADIFKDIDLSSVGTIGFYEKPWKKQFRHVLYHDSDSWKNLSSWSTEAVVRNHLKEIGMNQMLTLPIESFDHHLSHAAAGFQTSPFSDATVVVVDAIGEWDCISIWDARYGSNQKVKYEKLWSRKYPNSLGMFYSAMTQRCGFKPNEEEYILMGMSAFGKPVASNIIKSHLGIDTYNFLFANNLQIGVDGDFLSQFSREDLAASTQYVTEEFLNNLMSLARRIGKSRNLVHQGGVALNCVANRNLGNYFEKIWIMPNPGDAGSSLGAAALVLKKKINWVDAYLGKTIEGPYPAADIIDRLLYDKVVGVASGAAEFGPRALGHRSLLADPRGSYIKDLVNSIKKREPFRPFAPMILEEFAKDYFEMPKGFSDSRYMQVVARCKYPLLYPAIVHVDGTSRVQTVPKNSRSGVRTLLEAWFAATGCPMILNTSLNIKGEPMVNDRADADRFEKKYMVKVCS